MTNCDSYFTKNCTTGEIKQCDKCKYHYCNYHFKINNGIAYGGHVCKFT